MPLAKLTIDLEARLAKLQEGMDRAVRVSTETAGRIEASFGGIRSLALGIGTALAGAFSASAIVSFTRATVDALDALNDSKDATGATIENLSALEDIARRNGGTLDDVTGILVKFNNGLKEADGKNGISLALKAIGVDATELRKLDPAEALQRVAQGLAKFEDNGQKARIVQELFGKSIREAAPFLKDLAEAGRLNATVTTEQAEAAERFNKQLYALQTNSSNWARNIVSEIVPALSRWFEGLNKVGGLLGQIKSNLGIDELGKLQTQLMGQSEHIERVTASLERMQEEFNRSGDEKWLRQIEKLRGRLVELQRDAGKTSERIKALAQDLTGAPPGPYSNEGRNSKAPSLPDLPSGTPKKEPTDALQQAIDASAKRMEDWWYRNQETLDKIDAAQSAIIDSEEKLRSDFLRSEKAAYEGVDQYVKDAAERMEEFAKRGRERIQDALGDSLFEAMNGNFQNIGDAFVTMLKRMVSEALAADIMGALFGKTSSGTGGGGSLLTTLFAFFGGGLASGGPAEAGHMYEVNEGGRPEVFDYEGRSYLLNGKSDGYVRPLGAGGSNGGGGINLGGNVYHVGEGVSLAQVNAVVQGAMRAQEARLMRLQREGRF